MLSEVIESFDDGCAAEQADEYRGFFGRHVHRALDTIGIVAVVDDDFGPPGMMRDDAEAVAAETLEVVADADSRRRVSFTSVMVSLSSTRLRGLHSVVRLLPGLLDGG